VYAPGHTMHHIAVEIESNDEVVLVIADASIHPLNLEHPTWQWSRAASKEAGIQTSRYLARLAVEHHALVLGYHFPFPGIGHVLQKEDGFEWVPLAI
jgi:glyoxylase-like metal-dependent hydrolase (beta-lactamase superfamily II)